MANVINKICDEIEVRVEMAYANDVEKVYVAKVADFGGYDKMTKKDRKLVMETAKDEVAQKFKYKLWSIIW